MELAVTRTIEALIGTDTLRAAIISNHVQQAALRDVIRDIGSHYLNPVDRSELTLILESLRALNGVRNKLVHGSWVSNIGVHNGVAKFHRLVRQGFVSDKDTEQSMHDPKNQKGKHLRSKHTFPPAQIVVETEKVRPLAQRLTALAERMNVTRYHPAEPKSQRRQAVHKQK